MIVGAILAQNTSWGNVERALAGMRARGLLRLEPLMRAGAAELEAAIRSSGTYRLKARKLRAFLDHLLLRHGGSLARMAREPTDRLRGELLSIWGIGPETADCILLYAFGRPVFVVDAYTERVLRRHGLHPGGGYEEVRARIEGEIGPDPELYNDLHAQLVWVGKRFCRVRPECGACPLRPLLPEGTAVGGVQ